MGIVRHFYGLLLSILFFSYGLLVVREFSLYLSQQASVFLSSTGNVTCTLMTGSSRKLQNVGLFLHILSTPYTIPFCHHRFRSKIDHFFPLLVHGYLERVDFIFL